MSTVKWTATDRTITVLMKTDAANELRAKLRRGAAAPTQPPRPLPRTLSAPVYPHPREIVIDCSDI